jgi:formylglycine-generating enzyme required for sulfatase activity
MVTTRAVTLLVALSGCNALAGIERAELDPSSSSSSGAGATSTGASSTGTGGGGAGASHRFGEACETKTDCLTNFCDVDKHCACPEGMVAVTRDAVPGDPMLGSYTFCIDRTEVTEAAYKKLLDVSPLLSEQPQLCLWNATYKPVSWPQTPDPALPAANMDWCDAYAYCRLVGKRLCGRVGGGTNAFDAATTVNSEWYVACSANGMNAYPYGNAYNGTACVGDEYLGAGGGSIQPVTSATECVSGGAYDLAGNVNEFEDACEPGAAADGHEDICRTRGGAYDDGESCVKCGTCGSSQMRRDGTSSRGGFRCCSG